MKTKSIKNLQLTKLTISKLESSYITGGETEIGTVSNMAPCQSKDRICPPDIGGVYVEIGSAVSLEC